MSCQENSVVRTKIAPPVKYDSIVLPLFQPIGHSNREKRDKYPIYYLKYTRKTYLRASWLCVIITVQLCMNNPLLFFRDIIYSLNTMCILKQASPSTKEI